MIFFIIKVTMKYRSRDLNNGCFTNFVTNSSNTEIKTFREPRTVAKFLEKAGVQQYEIELSNWNIEKIFDRHKAASALRVSASS